MTLDTANAGYSKQKCALGRSEGAHQERGTKYNAAGSSLPRLIDRYVRLETVQGDLAVL